MTQSTEQERAEFERELIDNHHYVPSDFSFKDGFYGGDDDYIQFGWDLWQAARRAPAAPVPQGWKRVPVEPTENMYMCVGYYKDDPAIAKRVIRRDYQAMLSAAPQPPEAASMISSREVVSKPGSGVTVTRLNLSDVGRAALQSKANHIEDAAPQPPEAAPVELPDPVYTMRVRGRMHDYTPTLSAFDLADGEHYLYTEQQVRQLMAAHGIQEQST